MFNPARLSADFYDPELIANEQQIRSGEFVPLGEVSQIIVPRPSNEPRKVLRRGDMRYPLDLAGLEVGRGSSEALRRGDIIFPRAGPGTPYLIRDRINEPVYASQFDIVIRISNDSKFTPEYLALYLSSSTGRNYAKRHRRGSIIPAMTRSDLETFPVVVASHSVVNRSAALFEAQFQNGGEKFSALERFNGQLFKPIDAPENTIEADYLLEQLDQVKTLKLSALRSVMEADLREIETCLNAGAYKSCFVLCGSVIEALLLDWLSEIDRRDYVTTETDHTLFTLINELVGRRVFSSREADAAHSVRRSRNKVHPREMLRAAEITEKECRAIVGKTRKIIEKRVSRGSRRRGQ